MTKLRYRDLVFAAQSKDTALRKQGYEAFKAWIAAAPRLALAERLNATERLVLTKLFLGNRPRQQR